MVLEPKAQAVSEGCKRFLNELGFLAQVTDANGNYVLLVVKRDATKMA